MTQSTAHSDLEITLGLLRAVNEDAFVTQRSAARELGIALGLANTYFKRCIKKGLIKANQIPANRYAYYLTPRGFAEKSRLATEFLSQSLNLFRQAQNDYCELFEECARKHFRRIALVGAGDLAQIVQLISRDYPVKIVAVIDAEAKRTTDNFHGVPVFASHTDATVADAYIISSLINPLAVYDHLVADIEPARVFAPALLDLETRAHLQDGEG